MKVSDYVIKFIEDAGVKHVFLVSGGGVMHLVDSASRSKKLEYVCNHHEQSCAIAAEGYQRSGGNLGVAIGTTGPGGTNLITGALCAWVDSVPVLLISGQANSKSLIGNTGLRQRGVQEADIIPMVRGITKYALTITDPSTVKYHLEKALFLAKNGRPGPVWLDMPLDVQGAQVDEKGMAAFEPETEFPEYLTLGKNAAAFAKKALELLEGAKRPVFLCGHGVRLSGSVEKFRNLVEKLKVPTVCAKNGYDVLPYASPYFMGMIGINGYRSANFTIQGADLIISFGCRMGVTSIGYNSELFAPHAKRVAVDIDKKQLEHPTTRIDYPMHCDVGSFIDEMGRQSKQALGNRIEGWAKRCQHYKQDYPSVLPEYANEDRFVNAYYFVEHLFENMADDAMVVLDQGASFYCPTQAGKLKPTQRLFTNGGIAPMGWGLPGAIGACLGRGKKEVICIHGDGGLQLNIQELQTIVHYKLPIKLFVFANEGYVSIKHTMKTYFGHLAACDPASGVSCPDTYKIAGAYGLPHEMIGNHAELRQKIKGILATPGPMVIEVKVDPMQPFVPKVTSERLPDGKMVSKPLDDMYPFLDRETYRKETTFEDG